MRTAYILAALIFLPIKSEANAAPEKIYKEAGYACAISQVIEVKALDVNQSSVTAVFPSGESSCTVVSYKGKKFILTNAHVADIPDPKEALEGFNKMIGNLPKVPGVPAAWKEIISISTISVSVRFKDNPRVLHEADSSNLDRGADLALITLKDQDAYKKVTAASFSVEEIEVGETVMAIGNPYPFKFVFTKGQISQIYKFFDGKDRRLRILTTPLMVGPGSSGGPLVNEKGRLIGIATGYFPRYVPQYSIYIHRDEIKAYLDEILK
jgi:S1-C subfamily serine protease